MSGSVYICPKCGKVLGRKLKRRKRHFKNKIKKILVEGIPEGIPEWRTEILADRLRKAVLTPLPKSAYPEGKFSDSWEKSFTRREGFAYKKIDLTGNIKLSSMKGKTFVRDVQAGTAQPNRAQLKSWDRVVAVNKVRASDCAFAKQLLQNAAPVATVIIERPDGKAARDEVAGITGYKERQDQETPEFEPLEIEMIGTREVSRRRQRKIEENPTSLLFTQTDGNPKSVSLGKRTEYSISSDTSSDAKLRKPGSRGRRKKTGDGRRDTRSE